MKSSSRITGLFALALLMAIALAGPVAADTRFMVPERHSAELPADSEVLHDYGNRFLVSVPEARADAVPRRAARLEDTDLISYRSWRGRAAGHDPADLAESEGGYYILALVGPMDPQWRDQLAGHGLEVVDHVNPYGVLVRGDRRDVQTAASGLLTSTGRPVVSQALPLPRASRISRDVAQWVGQRADAESLGMMVEGGKALVRVVPHADARDGLTRSRIAALVEAVPGAEPGNYSARFRVSRDEVGQLLDEVPEVGLIHAVYPKQKHNNIAPQQGITNIKPVWDDLGYTGSGIIAGVNDSGVDEEHPDFAGGVLLATNGAMSGTDNGHGTHVTGTIVSRGSVESPENMSSCGDLTDPLPDARGMAWGAQAVHNNLFEGGIGTEAAMMQWQSQQGAALNNNSWGYGGLFGPATDYGAETVAVDAAVRDADPDTTDINEQMSIVFAAGNSAEAGVSKPGNGKNVITVGASQNDRCGSYVPDECAGPDIDNMACFSSQGPSHGRIKPDIVAPGSDVLSTGSTDPEASWGGWDVPWTGDELALLPGTSMAAPVVTGAATIFYEYYLDVHGDMPSPALVKAALINTATDMGLGFPSNVQGWGRLNLDKAVRGPVGEDSIEYFDQDEVDQLTTGESWSTEVSVGSDEEPVRMTLVWTDPPGAADCDPCHVNDLDLVVTAPDGTVYRGNQFSGDWSEADAPGRDAGNNVENVFVQAPSSGTWQVEIDAFNVAENPNLLSGQDFALVVTGDLGGLSINPSAAEVCTADGSTEFTAELSGQFEGTTNLSAAGLPAGTSGSFGTNPVIFPDTQSIYTLGDLGSASGGDYTLTFTATDNNDASITAEVDADLTLYEAVPDAVSLDAPADGAIDQDLRPEFQWTAPVEGDDYRIQVATDSGFNTIVIDDTTESPGFVPLEDLATGTDYFWRVRSNNACGDGGWSDTNTFRTRFVPVAQLTPEEFDITVDIGEVVTETLSIANVGTGNLVWSLETDAVEAAAPGLFTHDPELDETFELPDFVAEGGDNPPVVEFTIEPGVDTSGDVIGVSFEGTAAGISDESSWASDTCMMVEAPDGTIFAAGGFSGDGPITACNDSVDWDFQGGGSSEDGTYSSVHDDVFDPPQPDDGQWSVRFVNYWVSSTAVDINWSDVTLTLHKQPPPVCLENTADVPWLTVSPMSGSTAEGDSEDVTVEVDGSQTGGGTVEGFICITTNDADQPLLVVPVNAAGPGPIIFEDSFEEQ